MSHTITHAKIAEEVDVEKCNSWNFRSVTLTLDQVKVTSVCAIHDIGLPALSDHVTVTSSSTEIWPFEISVISTFREV